MAAAPVTPKTDTPTEKKKTNRFADLFTAAIFKAAENGTIYTSERSGGKSQKLANVLVELAGTGGYVRGSIYAKQGKNEKTARAEFTFMGTQNQNCFTVEDSSAKAELDQWRAQMAADYIKWAGQTGHATPAGIVVSVPLVGLSLDTPTDAPTV